MTKSRCCYTVSVSCKNSQLRTNVPYLCRSFDCGGNAVETLTLTWPEEKVVPGIKSLAWQLVN